jgi:hypothetical protein
MKKILFSLVILLIVLFPSQVMSQDSITPPSQELYFCPDGNYYTEPCKPYYFEPGVTTGVFWYMGCRYYYPVYPNCPEYRYHPRYFHQQGYGRGYGGRWGGRR